MRKPLHLLIPIITICLLLSGCLGNNSANKTEKFFSKYLDQNSSFVPTSDKEFIELGRAYTTQLITTWINSRSDEEIDQNYIPLFHERFFIDSPMSIIRADHEAVMKELKSSEVTYISDESIEIKDEDVFVYTATVTTAYFYTNPEEGKESFESRREWSVKFQKTEQGTYKVRNYDFINPIFK